jgi:hypothetical protein
MNDLSAFEEELPQTNVSLKELLQAASEAIELEQNLQAANELVSKMNGRLIEIKTRVIPEAMAIAGLSDFTTPDGHHIKVESFVAGSLPKEDIEKRAAALEEIEKMGGEGIIKNIITLTFEKSQHNEALSIAEELKERGYFAEVVSSIHPQTLLAFVREAIRKGEEVDTERLGLHTGNTTKIKLGGEKIKKPKAK